MGLRATVIKKYEVEYGNANGFNYDPETLANIIGNYSSDSYLGGGGAWGDGYSTDGYWEIPKKDFVEMLEDLRNMSDEDFNENMEEEWYAGCDEKPYSRKYVIDVFEGFLEETPEDEPYIRFGWV